MPLVLNASAVIRCVHGTGVVRPVPSQQRLKVDGQPVLLLTDLIGAPIAGCTNNDPPRGILPCLTVVSVTAGQARKLTVGGVPVLLDSASGVTSSTPPGIFSVSSAGQSKVSAS